MKSIKEAGDLTGKRVLVRTDWNVPVENGRVTDTSRILASLETINFILDKGGKVVVISHFGREGDSIKPAFEAFTEIMPATLVQDPFSDVLPSEKVIVIENIRKWKEEEENDEEFAKKLAGLGDLYVNEAFSNSHREHASIVGTPRFLPSYAGFGLEREVRNLSKAFHPPHPFLFILGGAKFETKIPLLRKFVEIADTIFVLGANAVHIPESEFKDNPKIILPAGDIRALDANMETLEIVKEKIKHAKFVLWNGPLGDYEHDYMEGTKKLVEILVSSDAEVITGGGDTGVLIDDESKKKFSFISTAGGAMLEFLADGTLPGIEALN